MAEDFKRTGHIVEVIPVSEKDLGKRATAAFAAGDLPDVIYHTLQYVLPWAEAGMLDVETNEDIVNELQKVLLLQRQLQWLNIMVKLQPFL